MDWATFGKSVTLLLVLLNPFLMSIYLLDLMRDQDPPGLAKTLLRASLISGGVFVLFAVTGDAIFYDVLQVRFASFQVFGGVVFLLIGVRFVFNGPQAIAELRGQAEHVAGSVALPFMIGPGTVSASVVTGARLDAWPAVLAIIVALTGAVIGLLAIKFLHDFVRRRNQALVERYIDLVGRMSALVIGTIAIEMIYQGVKLYISDGPIADVMQEAVGG